MKAFPLFLIAALFCVVSVAVPAQALDCSNPPQGIGNTWWSEYASWCSACGGTPDSSTTSCTPGPNWDGGSAGGGGYGGVNPATDPGLYLMEQALQPIFNAAGQQLACLLIGNCPQDDLQRRQEQQRLQQLERAREEQRRLAEEERRRKEIERRARFEQAKERLLGEMRLQHGSGDLQPRPLGLEVREAPGSLQARDLVPRDLAVMAPAIGAASLRSPLARASCGAFLLRKSDEAAARGDFQEAAFLSREGAALISGEAVTTSVECPPLPSVPEVGEGVPILAEEQRAKAAEIEEALRKRSRFVSAVYRRVAYQSSAHRQADEAVRAAEERKEEARMRLEEARAAKAKSDARRQAPASPGAETPQIAAPEPEPAAESALAQALAALEAAEAVYGEAESDWRAEVDRKEAIEETIRDTRSLIEEVHTDPGRLDEVMEKLDRAGAG